VGPCGHTCRKRSKDLTHSLCSLCQTYSARLPTIYTSAQHLASASRGAGGAGGADIGDGSSRSGGGSSSGGSGGGGGGGKAGFGTSVGMSAEMVEFVNGLEETEKIGE
jgi:hypothetical protein